MDDIINCHKNLGYEHILGEINSYSNLSNDFTSIPSQLNRVFNFCNEKQSYIENQINDTISYQKKLRNIVSLNSPFQISISKHRDLYDEKIESFKSASTEFEIVKRKWDTPIKEVSFQKQGSNHSRDTAIAKVLRTALVIVREHLHKGTGVLSDFELLFQDIEDSINQLPKPNISQSINDLFVSSVEEIKGFLYSLLPAAAIVQRVIELTLLLYTKLGGLDTFLEWLYLILDQCLQCQCVIRTEILNIVLRSLLIEDNSLTNEIKTHIEDSLGVDIDKRDVVTLEEAIDIMFIAILILCKIEHNKDFKSKNSKPISDKNLFSDIYIWDYDKEIEQIKSAYPDSLCTRLKSSTQKPYNKQVICTQNELLMVNSLGEVSIRFILKGVDVVNSFKKIISPSWSPIQFPDLNVKIDQICVGFPDNGNIERQHVLALTRAGRLFSWGGGQFGKLGHGDMEDSKVPKLIVALKGYIVKQISTGINHSAAVTETGLAFIWGDGVSFNSDEPCLSPKRLRQDSVSNIICGPQSTFMVSLNQRDIAYLGTFSPEAACYKDHFLLPVHPNHIEWGLIHGQPKIDECDLDKIQKIAVNQSGLLVLLTNGLLYSLGHGLILGCPECRVHQTFERVQAMVDVHVQDVAISESHVTVLGKDVVYSWSTTDTALIIIEQSLPHHVTTVSATSLKEEQRQLNIAWSVKEEFQTRVSRGDDLNPYLYSTSIVKTFKSLTNIVTRCSEDEKSTAFLGRRLKNSLNLLLFCMKSDQFNQVILEKAEFNAGDELIQVLLKTYNIHLINHEVNKIIIEAISISSKVIYHGLEERANCILRILSPIKSLFVLSGGEKYLLETLIKGFEDESSPGKRFSKVYKLNIETLSDLLISVCHILTGDMIAHVRDHLNSARTDITSNMCGVILHEFAVFGYRIYLRRVQESDASNHNPISNLCRVLPMVNSVINCLNSYLHHINAKDRISQWILSTAARSVNDLFSNSPMKCVLSDVMFFLLDGQNKPDVVSLIPHISSTILSLNEINSLLPSNMTCDKQEMYFPLYGFPSSSNPCYSLSESGFSWVWLIDQERLAGLLYGNLLMKIIKSVSFDEDERTYAWIRSPLFVHICQLNQRRITTEPNLYRHNADYDRVLNLFLSAGGCRYRLWAKSQSLHLTGLLVYVTIVDLITSKYSHIDFLDILRFYGILYAFKDIIHSVQCTISMMVGRDVFSNNSPLTNEEEVMISEYAKSVRERCLCLQSLLSETVKNCQTNYAKKKSLSEYEDNSEILDTLDLRLCKPRSNSFFSKPRTKSLEQINDACSEFYLNANRECLVWLKGISSSLNEFLTSKDSPNTTDDLSKLFFSIVTKKTKSARSAATVGCFGRLFDTEVRLLDSVFIQIIEGMLQSTETVERLSDDQIVILESIFRIVVKKLKACSEHSTLTDIPQRMCVSILCFISNFNFMRCNFIRMIVEEDVLGLIVALFADRPFISTDNWLIMDGNGDHNLRNISSLIAWCTVEDLILNLSMPTMSISEEAKARMEEYLYKLVEGIFQQINDELFLKIFDLYMILNLTKLLYEKANYISSRAQRICWIELLLKIATTWKDNDAFNIFYSKYVINLCAIDLLSRMIYDLIGNQEDGFVDEMLQKTIRKFADFYYFLLTVVPKSNTTGILKSIECRLNSFKDIRSNENPTSADNWIFGNGNFDRNRSYYCDVISNDKISVPQKDFTKFIAVTHEVLHSGVWQVTVDVTCLDSKIEFACGFIMNDENQWPTDYQTLMDLRKIIQPISLSSKASLMQRVECVIDIDECIVYFINVHSGVQTFTGRDGFYRFFLTFYHENRSTRSIFEAHVVSVKKIAQSNMCDMNNIYNNSSICQDDYIVRSRLYEAVIKLCEKKPEIMFRYIIAPLTEQLKYCHHIDHYSEKKITDPSVAVNTIFSLFLLCGLSGQHKVYKGETCTYISQDNDGNHQGIILNFNTKFKSKFAGLNFVDKLLDSSEISCTIHSLSTNVPLSIPIKYLIKDEIYGETILEQYFKAVFPNRIEDIVSLLLSLLKCISVHFYDVEVSNYEDIQWCSDSANSTVVEYLFLKSLSANLFQEIVGQEIFLEYFSIARNEKMEKNFKLIFQTVVKLSTNPSPIKNITETRDFLCSSMSLMEGFQSMQSEIDLRVAKQYGMDLSFAKLFLQSTNFSDLGTYLSKREKDLLIRVLKRSCSKDFVDSVLNQSNNPLSMVEGGSVTFNFRRRVLDSSISSEHINAMQHITLPQNEYDTNPYEAEQIQEMNFLVAAAAAQNSDNRTQRQRLIQDFFTIQNTKSKVSRLCPICDFVLKSDTVSLFAHLSLKHSHNCRKTFQHLATKGIDLEGHCSDIESKSMHCATVTESVYCVCSDYLKKRPSIKESRDEYETFFREHYQTNPLIGWTGTLPSEDYVHQKISDIKVYQPIKRPEIEEVSILGDNIFKEVNESKSVFNESISEDKSTTHKSVCDEVSFVCQLHSKAIVTALTRLQYSGLVLSSRNTILRLSKLVNKRESKNEVSRLMQRFMLSDTNFLCDIIRLVECGRFIFNSSVPDIINEVQTIHFGKEDFLSTFVIAFEDGLNSSYKIHSFMQRFFDVLEKVLTSTNDYFNLNKEADKSVLTCPSRLLVQIYANSSTRILNSLWKQNVNYEYWQQDVETLLELYSFGIINTICGVRDKIWCLDNLSQLLLLIRRRTPKPDVNEADVYDDLSTDDSQVVYLTNGKVKKLISTSNRQFILTADCEGTLRIWDIDSRIGLQQHLQQTLLFSLGDIDPKDCDDNADSTAITEESSGTKGISKHDVSEYLHRVGIQLVAVSFNGLYIAETIGIYLNIWSTKSVFSQPQQVTLPCNATTLHFPELTFNGICGAPVDQLLIGLTNGEVLLLRILDNGSRITQKIIKARVEENISITAIAWERERNPIAVGYNDGLIVLTDILFDVEYTPLESIHDKRVHKLIYSPYPTLHGKYLLASSSFGEPHLAVWNLSRIVCVISLGNPVTCMEWLPRRFVLKSDAFLIVIGCSIGIVQGWSFDECGRKVENVFTLTGHSSPITDLNTCVNTGILVSGCGAGLINVWHIKDRSLLSTFCGSSTVVGAEWTPQNNLVVAWSQSPHVNIWQHFNDAAFQKNGLRQWALIRELLIKYTGARSIKHLDNLKKFIVSINRLIIQQFNDEESFVKCGYSIVYSQYLQSLIHFMFSLDLLPSLIPCVKFPCLDVAIQQRQTVQRELSIDNFYQRRTRCHALNRNNPMSRCSDSYLDWLFDHDELLKITQELCFEVDHGTDFVPTWWWNWCFESDAFSHNFRSAKWQNRYWSWDMQMELSEWFKASPGEWISNYRSSTYIWGSGKKGELNFISSRDWERPTEIKMAGIQQVVCGNALTLAITTNGNLFACGEGLEIVFNPYLREESSKMILVPVLSDFTITQVAVSKGSESHIIAITSSGDVYSWGIGSHGKLGHGHGTSLKKPKLIEGLRGKNAMQADCGHMHSAVVTSAGKLYTFGLGAYGQLGVEILTGSDTPRLVAFDDDDVKIGYVSCGASHTIAMTQDGSSVYAFGEGAFGKLGLGDFDNRYSPNKVDLNKNTSLKIACGHNFSAALTDKGDVLTWGHGDYVGLVEPDSDAPATHVSVPTFNYNIAKEALTIVDISAGNDLMFAVTTTGIVYGWGSNTNNLLLAGTRTHVYLPQTIPIGYKTNFKQISCGRYHACASSYSPHSYRYDIPTGPQLIHDASDLIDRSLYPNLSASDLSRTDLTSRLVLYLYWNELIRLTWQFWLPLTVQKYTATDHSIHLLSSDANWPLVCPQSYLLPESSWSFKILDNFQTSRLRFMVNNHSINNAIYRYIAGSMITNRAYGSLVKVSRIGKTESVFVQTCHQVLKMYPMELRLPWRAWKVKLVDEGADDAGGAYDETISEMCTELQASEHDLNLLIPSPCDSTVYLPNPNPNVSDKYFKFLGILMGTAIRTKKPIDLNLDPLFWKLMTRSSITRGDLIRIDPAFFNSLFSLDGLKDCDDNYLKEVLSIDSFVVFSLNRSVNEVIFNGADRDVNKNNLSSYVRHAISFRVHEFDRCIGHIRDGFTGVCPMLFLDLMPWSELERAVCGSRTISVAVLKSIARYIDADENNEIFSWFWDVIDQFTESEKSLFLRFVTGKSRLPSEKSHIPFRLFIYLSKQPVNSLPQAQTCFNQIRLPRYGSRADLESRLRIAISQCRSIDMDDYMLVRNRDA